MVMQKVYDWYKIVFEESIQMSFHDWEDLVQLFEQNIQKEAETTIWTLHNLKPLQ